MTPKDQLKTCCSLYELLLKLFAGTNDKPHFGQQLSSALTTCIKRALLQRSGELLQYPVIIFHQYFTASFSQFFEISCQLRRGKLKLLLYVQDMSLL